MDKIITATGLQQFRELLEGRFEIKNKDNSELFGGMGKETLQRNIQGSGNNAKNVLDQTSLPITKSNYIFKIEDDFDLEGRTVIVPQGSILDFEGGSVKNGQLKLNNTKFDGQVKLGSDIRFSEYVEVDLSEYTSLELKQLNPRSKFWYVLSNGEYVYTFDTSVQQGVTYFEKVGLNGTCSNDVFEQSWFENNNIDAFLDFASYVDSTSDSICLNFQPGLYNPTVKCKQFNTTKSIIINGNNAILNYSANVLSNTGFTVPVFDIQCPQENVQDGVYDTYAIPFAVTAGLDTVILDRVNGLSVGDFIILRDTNTSSFDYTRNYLQGEVARIKKIDTTNRILTLDNPVFGNYVNVASHNGSVGCVAFKCNFGKASINNITLLSQSGMTGKNNTVGILTNWVTLDVNNVTIKEFDKCFMAQRSINSVFNSCTFNTRPGTKELGDGYGLHLANVQNVNINGGDYRGRNHGIATGEGYGAKWNEYGQIAKVVYDVFVCRWVFISNVYAKSYRSDYGINTHAGSEYITVSSCIADGLSLAGSKYMVSSNILTDGINVTSTQLDSHIVNNICSKIVYNIAGARKYSNNANEVSFKYYTLDNTPENTLMIEGNTVYSTIEVKINYAKTASMYLYSLDGSSAVNHVYSRIESIILQDSTYYSSLFDDVRSQYNNGVAAQTCINAVLDILTPSDSDTSLSLQTKRSIFDNLISDIFIAYTDNVTKILTEGKIIISGNSCNNVVSQYNIFDDVQNLNTSTYYNKIEDMFVLDTNRNKVVSATFLRKISINSTPEYFPDYENNLSIVVKNNVINQYSPDEIVGKFVFVENNIIRKSNNMPERVYTKNRYATIANNNTYVKVLDSDYLDVTLTNLPTTFCAGLINSYLNHKSGYEEPTAQTYEDAALMHCQGFYYKNVAESTDNPLGKHVYKSWNVIPNSLQTGMQYEIFTKRYAIDMYFSSSEIIYDGATDNEGLIDMYINTGLANGTLIHAASWVKGSSELISKTVNGSTDTFYAEWVTCPSVLDYPYIFIVNSATSVINLRYDRLVTTVGGTVTDRLLIGKFEDAPTGDSLYPGVKYFCTDASNDNSLSEDAGVEIVYTGTRWVDCFGKSVTFGSNTPEPPVDVLDDDTDTNPNDDLDWDE